jgi:hypothetical protein
LEFRDQNTVFVDNDQSIALFQSGAPSRYMHMASL